MSWPAVHIAERITCKDGFSISIQAGWSHYCQPRENYERHGFWYKYELGYPSSKEDCLLEYAEDPESPLETVYGYVPKEIILEILERHGGPTFPEDCDSTDEKRHAILILRSLGYRDTEMGATVEEVAP